MEKRVYSGDFRLCAGCRPDSGKGARGLIKHLMRERSLSDFWRRGDWI